MQKGHKVRIWTIQYFLLNVICYSQNMSKLLAILLVSATFIAAIPPCSPKMLVTSLLEAEDLFSLHQQVALVVSEIAGPRLVLAG